jgi:TolA-binding protein
MPWRILAVALAALAGGGARAQVRADDPVKYVSDRLSELEQTLQEISRVVARLPDAYLKAPGLQPSYEVQSRLNDGQVAYFLQDYFQASLILFDIVENPRNRGAPGYEDALYYLADSLYQNRNWVGARKYFGEILQNPRSRYTQDALAKVVSIALSTGRHGEIDRFYARLVQSGAPIAPEVPYLVGKSLYGRGELERAAAVFAAIPASSPRFFPARFYLGATRARQGKYADAIAIFDEIRKVDPASVRGKDDAETRKILAQNQRIVELCHLALGRLHYELGDLQRASEAYQDVHRKSDLFPEALHELAWTWIKAKEYQKARRALEILMLSRHDLQFIPEAQVLLGDLQLLQGSSEEATSTYLSVKGTFEPVRKELEETIARHHDPVRYFNSLLQEKLDRMDPSALLPPIATRWVQASEPVVKAMHLVRDLASSRQQIQEANRIISQLEAALDAKDNVEIFPVLREGRAVALEHENKLVQARRVLTFAEGLLVRPNLGPDERAALAAAEAAREKEEARFKTIPFSKEDYLKRREEHRRRIAKLEEDAHKLGLQIDGLRAQIVAMVKFWKDTRGQRTLTPEQEKEILDRIEREREEIRGLFLHQERLLGLLGNERAKAGVGDRALAVEDRIRERFSEAVERERAALAPARSRLSGERLALVRRMDGMRDRIAQDLAALSAFRERLKTLVASRTQELRQKVDAEKRVLARYQQELAEQEGESEQVVGRVAYANYQKVQKKFYDLVIKADRGLTEIAWREKEKRSRRVRQLVQDKKSEIKVLEQEFKDVLAEE